MKKRYMKYSRIVHNFSKQKIFKRFFGLRFKLGFSRATSKKSIRVGRFSFLHTRFTERSKEENTRLPINPEMIWTLPSTYSFIVISDIHLKKNDTRMLENLQHAFIKGDSFIVVTGDITATGGKEGLKDFVDIMQKMPVPCYPVIGNHDIYKHNWPTWQSMIGETVYRVDKEDTTLIMLDSANGYLGKNQLEWLEQQLQTRQKHVFVFSHCNFFIPRRTVLQQFASFAERRHFVSICKGKVDAVFTGHSHKQYSHIAEGVLFQNMEDFRDKGTFCRVHVSPKKFQCTYARVVDITANNLAE